MPKIFSAKKILHLLNLTTFTNMWLRNSIYFTNKLFISQNFYIIV